MLLLSHCPRNLVSGGLGCCCCSFSTRPAAAWLNASITMCPFCSPTGRVQPLTWQCCPTNSSSSSSLQVSLSPLPHFLSLSPSLSLSPVLTLHLDLTWSLHCMIYYSLPHTLAEIVVFPGIWHLQRAGLILQRANRNLQNTVLFQTWQECVCVFVHVWVGVCVSAVHMISDWGSHYSNFWFRFRIDCCAVCQEPCFFGRDWGPKLN